MFIEMDCIERVLRSRVGIVVMSCGRNKNILSLCVWSVVGVE